MLNNGIRIDLRDVVGFRSNQETKQQRSDPLNGLPIEFNTPSGWRGSFDVDRANDALDRLFAANETAFWTSGIISTGTLYTYITERTGGLSTYQYIGCAFTLQNAGDFKQEAIVRQTVNFFASQRVKV